MYHKLILLVEQIDSYIYFKTSVYDYTLTRFILTNDQLVAIDDKEAKWRVYRLIELRESYEQLEGAKWKIRFIV